MDKRESFVFPRQYRNGLLKVGTILPLFKGKGVKASNKDNYRGITLFPTLCDIYEMVLLNRLKKYAERRGFFTKMQFGFQEGVSRPGK